MTTNIFNFTDYKQFVRAHVETLKGEKNVGSIAPSPSICEFTQAF